MKRTVSIIVSTVLVATLSAVLYSVPTLALGEGGPAQSIEVARGTGVPTNLANGDGSLVRRIIDIMLLSITIVSVIMLIIGGFRYVVSGGQKESVTAAKNTILYAIVGLLIALFAFAIIKFVLNVALTGNGGTDV
ncbi:MAG: hypothetical protein Q4A34_02730 [Candidatus Saccharibacteria bacterium]|nr:hypothetical protein [Candidatus Saccharibacteria bacterium]